ncbi:hypothetical protein SAMN04489762_1053 [Terribacillus saccharophilus]|uniref:Uncharacterized protein n=1 Tax=Terribacillus saccharophilus TaxID=361277 RepID=A0AAX2ED30_9BACI|nr:hypothetical protein SAMN04489762_1053 [Terribacillus saccharophilus]
MDWNKYKIIEEKGIHFKEYEIEGKHGIILLQVPIKEDTQEEIDTLHRVFAEVVLDELRREKERNKNASHKKRNDD